MHIRQTRRNILLVILTLTAILAAGLSNKGYAKETNDAAVRRAMVKRTDGFCNAVLPAWFAAQSGINDPDVRSLVTDCYTGHVRLAIMGIKSRLPLEDTSLPELPSLLLSMKTGMDLDVYRPMVGRVFQGQRSGK